MFHASVKAMKVVCIHKVMVILYLFSAHVAQGASSSSKKTETQLRW